MQDDTRINRRLAEATLSLIERISLAGGIIIAINVMLQTCGLFSSLIEAKATIYTMSVLADIIVFLAAFLAADDVIAPLPKTRHTKYVRWTAVVVVSAVGLFTVIVTARIDDLSRLNAGNQCTKHQTTTATRPAQ